MIALAALLVTPSSIRDVHIDFESFKTTANYEQGSTVPAGARFAEQYLRRYGLKVSSSGGFASVVDLNKIGKPHATSGRNGLCASSDHGLVDYTSANPIVFQFSVPGRPIQPGTISHFSIRQDLVATGGAPVTLRAYDAEGRLLTSKTYPDESGSVMSLDEFGMHRVELVGGSSTAYDDLSFTMPREQSRPHNGALRFMSDDQVAVVQYQKLLDVPELTLECWIKIDRSARERFFNYMVCRNYGNLGYGLAMHGTPGKVSSQAPAKALEYGKWTHIAAVCSRTARKMYVNGELVSVEEGDARTRPFAHALMIGNSDMFGEPGHTRTPLKGSLDELRIWSIPHTQRQIRYYMTRRLTGRERGLVAYFNFDEGSGQLIHDRAGHLLPGTLGGSDNVEADDPTWTEGPKLR